MFSDEYWKENNELTIFGIRAAKKKKIVRKARKMYPSKDKNRCFMEFKDFISGLTKQANGGSQMMANFFADRKNLSTSSFESS